LAAVAHYKFATIHPWYDGNGRVARLLTSMILRRQGYGLKGLYSLEEYYAQDLPGYYRALSLGPSHNYYEGRTEADITPWLEYFLSGMRASFESVRARAQEAREAGHADQARFLSEMEPRQRLVLIKYPTGSVISSRDIAILLRLNPRTARFLCSRWIKAGFLKIMDSSRKRRLYKVN
jgi:Fic family protein